MIEQLPDDGVPPSDDADWLDEIPDTPFGMSAGLDEINAADSDAGGEDGDLDETKNNTPSIDEGDFIDPYQHKIFVRLKRHIRDACNTNSKHDARLHALEWIFVPSHKDSLKFEFDQCCLALGSRPSVMRARTAHQLWKANILLSEPLPFLSHPPPLTLVSEIEAKVGPGLPADLAREVWYWPSIPLTDLREKYKEAPLLKYQSALDGLLAEGYVAVAAGRAYFVSRNPSQLGKAARNRFSFSASMFGE